MKKTAILFAALAFVFGSCQRIEESFVNEGPVSGEKMTIEATLVESTPGEVSSDALETKSALQPNGVDIWWTPGDAINLFYGSSTKSKFTANITEPFPTASFEGSLGAATGSAEQGISSQTFWGVYPYDAENTCDGSSVTLKILGTQVASAGSFGVGMNPSVANSPGLSLSFYNVGSWFRFYVTQDGITSATFSGNAGEILAGKITVTMDSNGKPLITNVTDGLTSITVTPEDGGAFVPGQFYYITLIPQTIGSTGYTLTLYKKNQYAECVTADPAKTYAFERSKYRSKKNADEGLTWKAIPSGPLCFTAIEDGTIALTNNGSNAPDVKYSTDGTSWTQWDYSAITVPAGGKVYFKGNNSAGFSTSYSNYSRFVITGGKIAASGSVQSLIYGDDFENNLTIPEGDYCFYNLFQNCYTLTTPPALPATTLGTHCYASMFSGCEILETAPELPATTMANYCYNNMFQYCYALTTPPALPATELADACYYGMFRGCTSLAVAPKLPATTMKQRSYSYMFDNCTTMATAPALPAETLERYCYDNMFTACSNLTVAPELPATTLANYCYQSMFSGCSSLTTAPKLPATTLANYCYQKMFSSCISLTAAPELPAETLATACYYNMFRNCSSLSYIKMMAKTIPYSSCLQDWVNGVASTGTFVKNQKTTLTTGANGIPAGWTVQEYVEMGDGLKWAIKNVGANSPEDAGYYLAWGETQPKTEYSWNTYFDNPSGDGNTFTKYATDKKKVLDPEDDAARVNWGGTWRMQTRAEWDTLCDTEKFDWTWVEDYNSSGSYGYLVTSKVTGYENNSIFLPAGGIFKEDGNSTMNHSAGFWASGLANSRNAFGCVATINGTILTSGYYRSEGRCVRPVFD